MAVEEASFHTKDDHDEATYLVKHSRDLINAWKAHQLRTVRQDQSRLKILILSRTAPKEVPLWSPLWHISLKL